MQISEEHRLAMEMDAIEDEWLGICDRTTEINLLARELHEKLNGAAQVMDRLSFLSTALERGFVQTVKKKVELACRFARNLVVVTGGFPSSGSH